MNDQVWQNGLIYLIQTLYLRKKKPNQTKQNKLNTHTTSEICVQMFQYKRDNFTIRRE